MFFGFCKDITLATGAKRPARPLNNVKAGAVEPHEILSVPADLAGPSRMTKRRYKKEN